MMEKLHFVDATTFSGLTGTSYGPEAQAFEHVVTPHSGYYDADSDALMRTRGIIRDGETAAVALSRATSALLRVDTELEGAPDAAFAERTIQLVEEGVIIYGTPVLTNAGRKDAVTAACTVLPLRVTAGEVDLSHFELTSRESLSRAVGTGYDLSELRNPAEDIVLLNRILDDINKQLLAENKRPVASMATLRADHPGIVDFVRVKREANFSDWRFNLSVFVTPDLFVAAERGEPWALRDTNDEVINYIDAGQLLHEIAASAHYCGEPGILFKDRIDADNPTPQWQYKSTAPCAEVAMSEGEACQFSYINLGPLIDEAGEFDAAKFGMAVETMTRLLDASVEMTVAQSDDFPLVREKRRIGVGVTGFADLLIQLRVPYDSDTAAKLAGNISELIDYHSKRESVRLAMRRGPFPAFTDSRFMDAEWVRRKYERTTGAVSDSDWHALYDDIETHGIRHASTSSLPPTGTSSTIVGSSKSLEPIFSLLERGRVIKPIEALLGAQLPGLAEALGAVGVSGLLSEEDLQRFPFLRTARQLGLESHMAVQQGFQSFLDESLAKTVNVDNGTTVEQIRTILIQANSDGLKGITVFRDNCLAERTL